MDKFTYQAYDQSGASREGEILSINAESAKSKIKQLGLIPVKIDKVDETATIGRLRNFLNFEKKPGLADLEFLTSKISLLLKNGIKVDRALKLTQKGITNRRLKKIMAEVYEDIRKGDVLSHALGKHPDIFDSLYVSIVKIGEATGRLPQSFATISANLNFRRKIFSITSQALIYPGIIFLVCLGSIFFIFNFIVPKFSLIFTEVENLPVYTTLLLSVSDFFRKYQIIVIVGFPLLLVLVARTGKKGWYKRVMDALVIKLPVLRNLCFTLENLRFTSALAILLKNGVVLSEALDYAVKSISNIFLRQRVQVAKNEVRRGNKLSETMAKTDFLPATFDGLIEVGEQTGNLAEIFAEMENRLKTDYENQVKSLIALVEPLLIIVMGLVVGSIVVVMLLSMVSINEIAF